MTFTQDQPEKGTRWGQLCCPQVCVFCCWCGGCKGAVLCWSWPVWGWVCPSFFPRRYRYLALSIWVTPPWVISQRGFSHPLPEAHAVPVEPQGSPGSSRLPSWRISSALSYLRKPWVCTSLTIHHLHGHHTPMGESKIQPLVSNSYQRDHELFPSKSKEK